MTGHGRDEVRLDPRNLRALAHPLRIRLLGALRLNGPATASQLGKRLGESSGATSYHLRRLAECGFVEEDEGRGTARERWWRAVHETTRGDAVPAFLRDPLTRESAETYLREVAAVHTRSLAAALDEVHALPPEWVEASTLGDVWMWLTAEEAGRMAREVYEVLDRWRRTSREDAPEGAEQVVVQVHSFPHPERDR